MKKNVDKSNKVIVVKCNHIVCLSYLFLKNISTDSFRVELIYICLIGAAVNLIYIFFSLFFREEEAEMQQAMSPFQSVLAAHPSDVLDMPVDPNEPTYCLCNQVSYGEMIGCDNLDVSSLHFIHCLNDAGESILVLKISFNPTEL